MTDNQILDIMEKGHENDRSLLDLCKALSEYTISLDKRMMDVEKRLGLAEAELADTRERLNSTK